jgi:hypothetical protein
LISSRLFAPSRFCAFALNSERSSGCCWEQIKRHDVLALMHEEQIPLLTISVRWGADLLHVAHRSPPESFLVGESARPPFGYAVPAALLGVERAPLVRVDESRGEVWLVVLPRAVGTIGEDGKPSASLRSWIDAGRAERHDGIRGAYEVRMPLGSRATVEFGALVFEVEFGLETWPAEEAVAAPALPAMAARRFAPAVITVALHAGLLVASAFAMPSLGEAEDLEYSQDYLLSHLFIDGLEREPTTEELADEDVPTLDGDDREFAQAPGGRMEGGSMGEPSSEDDGHHWGVQGPSDNPDPHIARSPSTTATWEFGLGNENVQWGGDAHAPTMPWGRDDSLGNDATSATGRMWGDRVGASFGVPGDGAGKRKLCSPCGGDGRGPRLSLPTTGGGATGTESALASVTAAEVPSARRR